MYKINLKYNLNEKIPNQTNDLLLNLFFLEFKTVFLK